MKLSKFNVNFATIITLVSFSAFAETNSPWLIRTVTTADKLSISRCEVYPDKVLVKRADGDISSVETRGFEIPFTVNLEKAMWDVIGVAMRGTTQRTEEGLGGDVDYMLASPTALKGEGSEVLHIPFHRIAEGRSKTTDHKSARVLKSIVDSACR